MNKRFKQLKKRICAVGMVIAAAGVSVPAAIGTLPAESVYAAGDIAVNATNFPDENFRSYVSEHIDKDGDGKLSEGEIASCTEISCNYCEISSLKGIEHFTALTILHCEENNLICNDLCQEEINKNHHKLILL